ncbi:Aldo/keto reductase [Mucidula mucida]|nr:Aldo/keto reductase [Mucidula mucida]
MSSLYEPVGPPASKLGYYRVLSPLAAIRVSPIVLGAMSIGDKWQQFGFGVMDKDSSSGYSTRTMTWAEISSILQVTSDQNGSSEAFIGEWMEKRNNRNELVIATKYSSNRERGGPQIRANEIGNNLKVLHVSVAESLKTSVTEIMNGLHSLVMQGKVLYLGISDAPAWFVSQANMYAQMAGKTPFSIYQGHWNVLDRSFEREVIPMAKSLGLALAPWDVLRAGKLRTDAEEEEREKSGEKGRMSSSPDWKRNDAEKKMTEALEKIAAEHGTKNIRAIAIAYVMQKVPYVFPILGGRKVEQLTSNMEALDITLTPEQFTTIESVTPFDVGFPLNIIGDGSAYNVGMKAVANFVKMPAARPMTASV